jgi:hypothetical protein
MFCCNLSGRESVLLHTILDYAWMCAVSSVLFMLDAIEDPTNVIRNLGPLMRGL